MPPGHLVVALGRGASMCRRQYGNPVSLSIAKILFDAPAMMPPVLAKPYIPLIVIPWLNDPSPLAVLSSCSFHCSPKAGVDTDCTEMFGSTRSHEVRCKSALAVLHSKPMGRPDTGA
jgi:hypothetical protein